MKIYIQETENIFTAMLHEQKKIEDFDRGKKEVENIIKVSFETRVPALLIKLAYNCVVSI